MTVVDIARMAWWISVGLLLFIGGGVLYTAVSDFLKRRQRRESPRHEKPQSQARRYWKPEVIVPKPPRRGACGIVGCRIRGEHSHVMDLVRRLKGK